MPDIHTCVPHAPVTTRRFSSPRFSHDDQPGVTEVFLEEGAAGKTDVDAVLVMDGISDAKVKRSLY